MRKHHSLQVAETVIAALDVLLLREIPENFAILQRIWVECLDNCREQGLVVTASWGRLGIVRCWRTESIIVWKYTQTQHPSNLPDWKNVSQMSFPEKDFAAAAEFCYEALHSWARADQARSPKKDRSTSERTLVEVDLSAP